MSRGTRCCGLCGWATALTTRNIKWTKRSGDFGTLAQAMVRLDRPDRRIGVQGSGGSPSAFAVYEDGDDGLGTTIPAAPIDLAHGPVVDPEVAYVARSARLGAMCARGPQETKGVSYVDVYWGDAVVEEYQLHRVLFGARPAYPYPAEYMRVLQTPSSSWA